MKFGPVPPQEAIGGTAVHTIRQGALVLKKGTLIGPVEAAALDAAGIQDIVVARLEPGDISEDVAAAEIAAAISGEGVHVDRAFTGRSNLFAAQAELARVSRMTTMEQLAASIDTLRYDTNAIERLARERLRYAKPGETIVVFEPPNTNQVTR